MPYGRGDWPDSRSTDFASTLYVCSLYLWVRVILDAVLEDTYTFWKSKLQFPVCSPTPWKSMNVILLFYHALSDKMNEDRKYRF